MIKISLFIVLCLVGIGHSTIVGGAIFNDTVWSIEGSTYEVMEDVIIHPEGSLTIDPGVTVEFRFSKKIYNRGKLIIGKAHKATTVISTDKYCYKGRTPYLVNNDDYFFEYDIDSAFDMIRKDTDFVLHGEYYPNVQEEVVHSVCYSGDCKTLIKNVINSLNQYMSEEYSNWMGGMKYAKLKIFNNGGNTEFNYTIPTRKDTDGYCGEIILENDIASPVFEVENTIFIGLLTGIKNIEQDYTFNEVEFEDCFIGLELNGYNSVQRFNGGAFYGVSNIVYGDYYGKFYMNHVTIANSGFHIKSIVYLENCVVEESSVDFSSSFAYIKKNKFIKSEIHLQLPSVISDNSFSRNTETAGLILVSRYSSYYEHCIFKNNYIHGNKYGIVIADTNQVDFDEIENKITGNTTNKWNNMVKPKPKFAEDIQPTGSSESATTRSDGKIHFYNNTISENVYGLVKVQEVTDNIPPGNNIFSNSGYNLVNLNRQKLLGLWEK
eukprot:TRINITY_DN3254_c0_g1_i1.p1 TRINITY_DN3254_c0_g1~~TRINITY_DN3254_c0_g1_i1.p1  ORF type:complete len:492 (+),score=96.82 TRINITY_DN3254_c0_g1_i1:31-1506(+)